MRPSVEKAISVALTVVVTLAAAGTGAAMVHREFFKQPIAVNRADAPSVYLPNWRELVAAVRLVGDSNAAIKIIEFTDFECPFCRLFNTSLHTVQKQYAESVAYILVHRPLPMHRFAKPAAIAAECASSFGRFVPAVDLLFEKQDSLGLKSWKSFAAEAGIQDTSQFANCMDAMGNAPMGAQVARGLEAAEKLGIRSTPTVILNGWRYSQPPSDTELVRAVSDLLAGKQPYPGFPSAK